MLVAGCLFLVAGAGVDVAFVGGVSVGCWLFVLGCWCWC